MLIAARTKDTRKPGAALAVVMFIVLTQAYPAEVPRDKGRPVSLYVTVEEGGGLVRGLTAENFRLQEEDRPRPFEVQAPENPSSIVLLVEYSQSSWLYFEDIHNALQGFMNVAPEGNWYALATYSHGMSLDVDFTKQKGKIVAAFADIGQPSWNEIDTYDAVYQVLESMDRLQARRVVIVIGSGFDSFSSHTLDDVQKKIESANVLVYGVGAGSLLRGSYEPYLGSSARMDLLRAEAFLKMLADKSGGEAWFPRFEGAFPDVMKGIMQSLENQYKLAYVSQIPADGKFHKIKVEAFQVKDDKRHNFKVRAREGWRF